jgi:hypothetical protein
VRYLKKIAYLGVLLFSVTVLSGCARAVGAPVTGFLVTSTKTPSYRLQAPLDATIVSKTGTASAISILGLIGIGDASITMAAKNGKITKIHHVDQETFSFLGLYASYTVVVYGE